MDKMDEVELTENPVATQVYGNPVTTEREHELTDENPVTADTQMALQTYCHILESDVDELEGTIASEPMFANWDRLLLGGQDSPTLVYYVCWAGAIPMGLMWWFTGSFFTPSFVQTRDHDDPVMGAAVIGWGFLCISIPLINVYTRQAMRCDAEGALILLGAGQQLISPAQDKALRRRIFLTNAWPGSFYGANLIGGGTLAYGFVLITGVGLQSPTINRISGFLGILCLLPFAVVLSWPAAFTLATTLVDARTNSIRAVIRRHIARAKPGSKELPADWDDLVVRPAKDLVRSLDVLNATFSRGECSVLAWHNCLLTFLTLANRLRRAHRICSVRYPN
eukprot:SAG31_NODE_6459_length_2009_cov_1.205236_1_plen_337_part_00